MKHMPVIEVCLDSVESAIAAEAGGADRVELCGDLAEGGTTPSLGTIELVRESVSLDVRVMIRPRGGDFLYSAAEIEIMRRDIALVRRLGVKGIVLGLLDAEGRVDREATAELVELARPLEVTFHRAFDMTRDPREALDALVALGVERVLTSGGRPRAVDALDLLRDLVRQADGLLNVLVGGGIDVDNARRIAEATAARELHVGGEVWETVESGMRFRNSDVAMGEASATAEYLRKRVSSEAVRAVVAALRGETTPES